MRVKVRKPFQQGIVLCRIVAKIGSLLVLARAVAAKDKVFARIVVPILIGRDRLLISRRMIHANGYMRSQLANKKDKK